MKRAFIIHKWKGTPDSDWYPWLKSELEGRGYEVHVPAMPNTNTPKVEEWVPFLSDQVGKLDAQTYLVGHSMGCQAILRYLAGLAAGERAGGAVLVAGFTDIRKGSLTAAEEAVIRPWIESKIDMARAREHSARFVSVLSGNDPYVKVDNAKVFEKELGASSIIIPKAGHFTEQDGYKELHVVLNELLKMP